MTSAAGSPEDCEFELTLLGPGYGESVAMHVGAGAWVVVDSFMESDDLPAAVRYLEEIGVDPAEAVMLIVATHWHDDHIGGIARLVELCPAAKFCCASALCDKEFLALVGALEGRHFSAAGSGLREIYGVFSHLEATGRKPAHALANRVVFRKDGCAISSLSPSDGVFQRFLKSIERLIPGPGANKTRMQSLSPNETSVALWIECGECSVLLGADLERQGWAAILGDKARPAGKASAFKVPHHGSEGANEPAVWDCMLEREPVAVLAPWRRGRGVLPTGRDVARILTATPEAWITTRGLLEPARPRHGNTAVDRTLRESGARFRRLMGKRGMVRLRRSIASKGPWTVETLGDACRLADYAA